MAGDDPSSTHSSPSAAAKRSGFRWFIPIVTIVFVVAVIAIPAALPTPAFSLGPLTSVRTCHVDPAGGNYSFWLVSFDLTNHGASASAASVLLLDGKAVAAEHVYVASGATTTVHANLTDEAIPVDTQCAAHNVTAEIWGYVL